MSDGCGGANIGVLQRRRRVKIGLAALSAAILLAAGFVNSGAGLAMRTLTVIPLWVGALSLLEARNSVCVLLVARGVRNMDSGEEPIRDSVELRELARRARVVHIQAALIAVVLTGVVFALP